MKSYPDEQYDRKPGHYSDSRSTLRAGFIAFNLSMPRRGPKCKPGYHRVFNLILWVRYRDMQWKCLPVPRAGDGTVLIHCTTIYKVFVRGSDDGSLDQVFGLAAVRDIMGAVIKAKRRTRTETPSLLDVVALLTDLPTQGLVRGQVGTVVG